MLTQPSLTLARRLNAAPAKVFAAWTDPEKIIRWFGPAETVAGSVKADMDVRVGGGFRISFTTVDGEYHEVGGNYREVVADQRLVFSWAWHSTPERVSVVTVTIKPDADGSLLTLNHGQFFDEAARDGHRRGWTGTLDKLEKMFA
ncbi:SRPBCC family protein [Bradyrhizobium sp. 2TAF24]|uniref:SRPBCC family protein n=1 Tax=Bradyrhizobium sp. 2TAF24 TaxID=3233011 RepID=UPI003F92AEA3